MRRSGADGAAASWLPRACRSLRLGRRGRKLHHHGHTIQALAGLHSACKELRHFLRRISSDAEGAVVHLRMGDKVVSKTLFFDMGYTLVDEGAVWQKRCEEQAATEEAKCLGLSAEVIYQEIEKASLARLPQYRTVINKFRFKTVAPYRHELEELYGDAPNVLKTLSEKYELGVIANQTDGLRERLERFGILQYFTHVISSWDVQIMKPDTRIYEYALKTSKCRPYEAVMIGDRLDNDVAPAKAVGMKTVWIKQGFGGLQTPLSEKDTPDYVIEGLSELLKIF